MPRLYGCAAGRRRLAASRLVLESALHGGRQAVETAFEGATDAAVEEATDDPRQAEEPERGVDVDDGAPLAVGAEAVAHHQVDEPVALAHLDDVTVDRDVVVARAREQEGAHPVGGGVDAALAVTCMAVQCARPVAVQRPMAVRAPTDLSYRC